MNFNLRISLILLTWSGCYVNGDLFEQLRQACPYSKFCIADSLKEIGASDSDKVPCCLDCFCDEACYSYGDCCPDVEPMVPGSDHVTKLGCVTPLSKTPYLFTPQGATHTQRTRKYVMYDRCPAGFSDDDDTIVKCGESGYRTLDFDDLVMVSDTSGRIFKNKHCALCHGVTHMARWTLVTTTCKTSMFEKRFIGSEVDAYLYDNCILQSVQPTNLSWSSRSLLCDAIEYDTCPDEFAKESEENRKIDSGCNDGPVMPEIHEHVYKNALCKLCNGRDKKHLCTVDDVVNLPVRSPQIFSMAITIGGTRWLPRERPTEVCDESHIYHQGQCIELYCPPFHAVSYGECHQLPHTFSTIVSLLLYFPCNATCEMSGFMQSYDTRQAEIFDHKLYQRFMQFGCPIASFVALAQQEQLSYRLESIVIELQLQMSSECTIRGIGNMVRKLDKMVVSWLLNGDIVVMEGRFSFFLNPEIPPSSAASFVTAFSVMKRHRLKSFLVCPYTILDVDGYDALVSRIHGDDGSIQRGDNFTVATETIPGTYALSGDMIAVCIDVYLGTSGCPTYNLSVVGASTLVPTLALLTKWLAF